MCVVLVFRSVWFVEVDDDHGVTFVHESSWKRGYTRPAGCALATVFEWRVCGGGAHVAHPLALLRPLFLWLGLDAHLSAADP